MITGVPLQVVIFLVLHHIHWTEWFRDTVTKKWWKRMEEERGGKLVLPKWVFGLMWPLLYTMQTVTLYYTLDTVSPSLDVLGYSAVVAHVVGILMTKIWSQKCVRGRPSLGFFVTILVAVFAIISCVLKALVVKNAPTAILVTVCVLDGVYALWCLAAIGFDWVWMNSVRPSKRKSRVDN